MDFHAPAHLQETHRNQLHVGLILLELALKILTEVNIALNTFQSRVIAHGEGWYAVQHPSGQIVTLKQTNTRTDKTPGADPLATPQSYS